MKSFLGLAGFYRRFIPSFSSIASPLTNLTKKDRPNQGSRGRRIRRPGTKRFGLERMVLLRDDSTDARFFHREASQKFIWFCLLATACFDDIAR